MELVPLALNWPDLVVKLSLVPLALNWPDLASLELVHLARRELPCYFSPDLATELSHILVHQARGVSPILFSPNRLLVLGHHVDTVFQEEVATRVEAATG